MRLGVIGHTGYAELAGILRNLCLIAGDLDVQLFFERELHEVAGGGEVLNAPDEIDALITLGGDGTLLRGARFLDGDVSPILGVNLGRLGFLTSCQANDAAEALRRLASGDYVGERRMVLAGVAAGADGGARHTWRALNDFVVHKGGFARVVRLRISIDGDSIGVYGADGVIISTPTGSTAYSLSAGGPVVVPTLESIVLTPVSAHTLGIRPLVIPPDAEVTLESDNTPQELLVTVDGQVGTTLGPGDRLQVLRSPDPVVIARFPGASFFERMRVKLGWGGLPDRDEPRQC